MTNRVKPVIICIVAGECSLFLFKRVYWEVSRGLESDDACGHVKLRIDRRWNVCSSFTLFVKQIICCKMRISCSVSIALNLVFKVGEKIKIIKHD